jgi:hypothetical protein
MRAIHSQSRFRDCAAVRARHVGNGDAPFLGCLQIDGVDSDADLLNQPEPGGVGDDLQSHGFQYMPKHVSILHRCDECRLVILIHDRDREPVGLRGGETIAKAWARAVLQHCTDSRRTALKPSR